MKTAILLRLYIFSGILLFHHFTKAQNVGDVFFSSPQIHEVYMNFTQINFWDSLLAYKPLEQYMQASLVVDNISYTNVGIKFKGNSSYNNSSVKKPFKVDLNEFGGALTLDGLKKFNLNNGFKDPTFLREKLALDFYQQQHIYAPRCTYAKVYINGAYWGLYTLVEEIDKHYLNSNANFNNKEGNLFKGDPNGSLQWVNNSPSSYYSNYELHTNETINDWSDLVHLIDKINNSGNDLYDSLETVLNTSNFIKQWAAYNLFVNLDSYLGSGHNYFIYHDTLSNKFEWIAWDVNEAFGNFNMGLTTAQLKTLSMFYLPNPPNGRPLIQKMLGNMQYKNEYIATFCLWLENDFSNAALDIKIDSLANAIRADVYADTKKFFTNQQFDDNITMDMGNTMGLKPFISSRRSALLAELALNNCTMSISEKTDKHNLFTLFPNPSDGYLNLLFTSTNTSDKINITISNTLGQQIYEKSFTGSKTVSIKLQQEAGIYFISTSISGKTQTSKLILY